MYMSSYLAKLYDLVLLLKSQTVIERLSRDHSFTVELLVSHGTQLFPPTPPSPHVEQRVGAISAHILTLCDTRALACACVSSAAASIVHRTITQN